MEFSNVKTVKHNGSYIKTLKTLKIAYFNKETMSSACKLFKALCKMKR